MDLPVKRSLPPPHPPPPPKFPVSPFLSVTNLEGEVRAARHYFPCCTFQQRGGSFCQPGEPVAGFSFLPMSLPALSGMANNIRINSAEAPSSLRAAPVLPETWQPRFAAPPASSSGAGDSSKSMLFSSLRCVGDGCCGRCRDAVAERMFQTWPCVSCHSMERSAVACFMAFHGEILSCVSCHSLGRSVMCLVSFHGEICHVSCQSMGRSVTCRIFHGEICLMSFHGEICRVSFHGEICCHVCHVIPWGDMSYSSCHFMGRYVVSYVVPWGDLSYVSCHSVERSAVMCLVILWRDLLSCVLCHSMGRSVMCLMSFYGEINVRYVSYVIPWRDLSCVLCHFMGDSMSDMSCHVSRVSPWGDLSCASCHFMGRSTSDMSCVLRYCVRSALTCHKSDQQGTCPHIPYSFSCGRVEFSQDYDLVCLTAQQVVMACAFVLMLFCLQ